MDTPGRHILPGITESDSCYRMLVQCVQDYAIYMLDLDGYVCSWNRGAERIKGYSAEEIIGQHFSKFYPPDHLTSNRPTLELEQARREGHFETEDWRIRKDGSIFLAQVVVTPICDEQGVMQGYAKVTREMTPRERMEDRFRRVVEYSPSAMVMINQEGLIEMVNTQTERMFGYKRTEMLNQSVEFLLPQRFREHHPAMRTTFFKSPSPRPMGAGRELYGLRKDGTEFPIEIGLNPIENDAGMLVLSVIVDISERKRLEELFRQVVQEAPSAMIMVDTAGSMRLFNRQAEKTFGYTEAEITGKPIEMLVPERFRSAHPSLRGSFLTNPEARPMGAGRDLFGLRKDGSEFPVEIGLNPLTTEGGTMVLAAVVDITSRRISQQQIETALSEKTVLLNEIHHRVKNNLQVIISLLNMQANNVSDDNARNVLLDSQTRVRSMALIHQLLYERHDFSRIDLGEYLQRLSQLLISSYGSLANTVSLNIDAQPDQVYIELHRATPCGLLINELVTNVFKHAYPDTKGDVLISLHQAGPNEALLVVADQGVGMPSANTLENSPTLGLQLIPILVDQIGGSLALLDNKPGVRYEIRFASMHEGIQR